MPWSIGDVEKHRKSLKPAQKKMWVRIANGVLRKCMSAGGSDGECSAKAIRIANSRFESKKML